MGALFRDRMFRCWLAGTTVGTLIGVFVTQAYWGVGLFR